MDKNNKNKIIVICMGCIIILLISLLIFTVFKFNIISFNNTNNIKQNQSDNKTVDNAETNIEEKVSIDANDKTDETKSSNTISFKQMEYNDVNLTDEQKTIALFFDEDFFHISSYQEMLRYADMLKNIKVSSYCLVDSILSVNDNRYEALCHWSFSYSMLVAEQYDDGDYIIIKGEKPKRMFLDGDILAVKGKLIGAETREINGKSKYIPIIEIEEMAADNYWITEDTIRNVAKIVFGNNIKVRRPTDDETNKMVMKRLYTYDDFVWLVEMENQSNINFKVFDIIQTYPYGVILYNGIYNEGIEADNLNRKLYVTPDLQKYIVFDMSMKDKYVYINIYDRQLNKLWQREISNVSQIAWDATNENLIFVSDNDLYNINITTGEDVFTPKYVGKRDNVNIVENGYILLSNDKDDAVMFLDKEGNIKNKYDLTKNDNTTLLGGVIQKLDDKYVIMFVSTEDMNSGVFTTKYIILDKDGNKLDESD